LVGLETGITWQGSCGVLGDSVPAICLDLFKAIRAEFIAANADSVSGLPTVQ